MPLFGELGGGIGKLFDFVVSTSCLTLKVLFCGPRQCMTSSEEEDAVLQPTTTGNLQADCRDRQIQTL
eukprot:9857526-Karenia_brevis.AAC.1